MVSSASDTGRIDKEKRLAEEMKASLVNGQLHCSVAFKVTKKLKVTPKEVGDTANRLKIRIINCQLGCFIVEKAVHDDLDSKIVSKKVMEMVQNSLVSGRLPCSVAFATGKLLKVSRQKIGDAADKLKVKIVNCQLGCFP